MIDKEQKAVLAAIEAETFATLTEVTGELAAKYKMPPGIIATHVIRACFLYSASCLKCMVGSKEAAELASAGMNLALEGANEIVQLADKHRKGK